eukprot:1289650-Rhodomonas_salina.1
MSQRLALPQHPRQRYRSLYKSLVGVHVEMSQRLALSQHTRQQLRSVFVNPDRAQVKMNQPLALTQRTQQPTPSDARASDESPLKCNTHPTFRRPFAREECLCGAQSDPSEVVCTPSVPLHPAVQAKRVPTRTTARTLPPPALAVRHARRSSDLEKCRILPSSVLRPGETKTGVCWVQ